MRSARGLLIDCAQHALNLALTTDDGEPDVARSWLTHNNLTDVAITAINAFLDEHHIQPQAIKHLYVVVGPGSFTGVRVACMIAKAWKLTYPECRLYAISSLRFQVPQVNANAVSYVAAGGKKVYCAVYANNNSHITVIDRDVLLSLLAKYPRVRVFHENNQAPILLRLKMNLANFVQLKTAAQLIPLYVKPATNV